MGCDMDFGDAIKSGFRNYVTFRGRAQRAEFWYWTLFAVLATLAGRLRGVSYEENHLRHNSLRRLPLTQPYERSLPL